jgi:hypothetical protein
MRFTASCGSRKPAGDFGRQLIGEMFFCSRWHSARGCRGGARGGYPASDRRSTTPFFIDPWHRGRRSPSRPWSGGHRYLFGRVRSGLECSPANRDCHGDKVGAGMRRKSSKVSISGEFLPASFGHLQEQVERLVGPLSERRSMRDRRRSRREFLGRRESDHFSKPLEEQAS